MHAPSTTPNTTTVTATKTSPAADSETLDIVWIGDPQGVEQKLPGFAPHVRVSVRDAASAVDALGSGASRADVVVIDTTTPGVDAQDILRRMKAAGTDLPILLITTSGSGRLVSDASQLAICDVVVKMPGFVQQLPAAFTQVRARHDLAAMFRESRQNQDRLRTILEFQPAVMCVMGPDGVLSAMNQAGLSLLGANQEQVVGRSLASFLPPEERDELLDIVRRACSGELCTLDHGVLKADGTRVNVRTQAVPFRNSQGGVALVTLHERSGPSAEELASLTGQSEAMAAALGEANAQLDKVRAERARESARADALSSELAESGTGLNAQLNESRAEHVRESARADALAFDLTEAVAALNVERERCNGIAAELATAKSMLDPLTAQCDSLAVALGEANAQLNENWAERARASARADALAFDLTEAVAALNVERERCNGIAAELATAKSMLDPLTAQCDSLAVALGEANAQSNENWAERARESARADALSSELAEAVAALNVERERCSDLLEEMATTKSMLEQSSRLQTLLEADHRSIQTLREQLLRFTADADSLCSGIIERQQGALGRPQDVADPRL